MQGIKRCKFAPLLDAGVPLGRSSVCFLGRSKVGFLRFSLSSVFASALRAVMHMGRSCVSGIGRVFRCSWSGL